MKQFGRFEHIELAYALMGSQGHFNAVDHDGRFDLTGRVQLALLKDPAHPYSPRRDDVDSTADISQTRQTYV